MLQEGIHHDPLILSGNNAVVEVVDDLLLRVRLPVRLWFHRVDHLLRDLQDRLLLSHHARLESARVSASVKPLMVPCRDPYDLLGELVLQCLFHDIHVRPDQVLLLLAERPGRIEQLLRDREHADIVQQRCIVHFILVKLTEFQFSAQLAAHIDGRHRLGYHLLLLETGTVHEHFQIFFLLDV